tara:strand:- start:520 stop:711 length:192 start_codon:yes stop_codon:yes gene_type:complete
MDSIKEIDLGSTLLSLFLGLGFVGLIIIIIRTMLISINYVLSQLKQSKKPTSPGNAVKDKKGF